MFGESMWAKLAANPKTAPMLKDPQMVAKLKMLQANPQAMMQQMLQDPQLMTVLSVVMGIDMAGASGAQGQDDTDVSMSSAPASPSQSKSTIVEVGCRAQPQPVLVNHWKSLMRRDSNGYFLAG
jgi:stress-induced-phosphoprotein 1